MNLAKNIGGAFLVGGVLSVVGQLLIVLFSFTPLYAQGLSTLFVLYGMGILGGALFLFDIYPKIERFGGMGAVMPFSGLMAAIASCVFGVGSATKSPGKGISAAFVDLIVKVVILGTVICAALGSVYYFAGILGPLTAPYAPAGIVVTNVGAPNGTEAGPPMGIPVGVDFVAFLWAFVVGGLICALAHAVLEITKLPVPVFLVIIFSLGALLVPTGAMKFLVSFGGAGCQVMVFDAGEAIVSTFTLLFQGNFLPFAEVLALFVALYATGALFGVIKLAMVKTRGDAAPPPALEQ
ncbi:MAG: SpoVA/SpoVAEb family sporulation membrane protein [Coriobacteriales bacterium]|jgi:hypothetical protein|nr:SpoVA/SpoVAEb family sporulation membrane protein [Coriobacteriales bacterium]